MMMSEVLISFQRHIIRVSKSLSKTKQGDNMRKHMLLFLLLLVASFAFAANLNGSTAEQSIWSMSTSNTGNNQSVANYRNLLPPSNFQANVEIGRASCRERV